MIAVDADHVLHVVSRIRVTAEEMTPPAHVERPRRSSLASTFDRAQERASQAARFGMMATSRRSHDLADNVLAAATDLTVFDDDAASSIRAMGAGYLDIGAVR